MPFFFSSLICPFLSPLRTTQWKGHESACVPGKFPPISMIRVRIIFCSLFPTKFPINRSDLCVNSLLSTLDLMRSSISTCQRELRGPSIKYSILPFTLSRPDRISWVAVSGRTDEQTMCPPESPSNDWKLGKFPICKWYHKKYMKIYSFQSKMQCFLPVLSESLACTGQCSQL